MSDAQLRIANNPFYEFMERDSTTIVANLSALSREITWVQDKQAITSDHYGSAAFIIGSQYDDLLQGGTAGDYIYGGAGNDTIKTGLGADRVDGSGRSMGGLCRAGAAAERVRGGWAVGHGGRYPAGVFSGYAAGIGILAAQAVLVRALETVPDVRKQIEEPNDPTETA